MQTLSEKAEWALKLAGSNEHMAYDTETSGLDWRYNKPVGYVFTATDKTSVYIPIRHKAGGNLRGCAPLETPEGPFEAHPFETALDKAFASRTALTIGHNLKFDWHASKSAGITLNKNLYCTEYGAAMLDEHARSYSLENTAANLGLTPKKGELMYAHLGQVFKLPAHKDLMGKFWELPGDDPVAVEYAEGDGITTIELFEAQQPRIDEEGIRTILNIEMELIWYVAAMERRGVRVDESAIERIKQEFLRKQEIALSKLPAGFNTRAPTMMTELFTKHGMTDWPKTELGNPSFKEKWLLQSELGRSIVDSRKIRTLLDQFIEPMQTRHVYKGRVHPSFHQLRGDDGLGTGPGRFSCSNPNLQQVPKHNHELAKLYRQLFVADEGMEFWEGDYSQCEPRLFAHYAKVPALLSGYNSVPAVDMHDVTAKMMDADRDTVAKRMNMGLLTGMWPKSFATHMGWDYNYALAKFKDWFRSYPEIKDFQDDVTAVFRETGWVRTILGRRCRLDEPRFAYRATSRIIQGSNADILKYKLLGICKMLDAYPADAHMLLTVHDSFEWQATAGPLGMEIAREIVAYGSRVQEPPFNLRVPFTMDVKKGHTWSEATFGKKIKFDAGMKVAA